jgi:putative endonuclease
MAPLALDRGRWGESVAARFLRAKGCKIIGRNWRSGHWEIDLIVRDGEVLVFVEVKTRRAADVIGGYAAAVTAAKRRSLRKAVDAYLRECGGESPHWRFDVIEILTAPRRYAAEQIFHFEQVSLDSDRDR